MNESIYSGDQKTPAPVWMRKIQVILSAKHAATEDDRKIYKDITKKNYTNSGMRVVFGDNTDTENFQIRISGTKFLALTKDNGTVEISNVSYDTIALIQALQLYRIEIKVGYHNTGSLETIAKGEVSFITQKIHSRHDSTLYISYASELVAGWSQSRINFSIRSGVNYYAMIQQLFLNQGANRKDLSAISPTLQQEVIDRILSDNASSTSIVEYALSTNKNGLYVSADSSYYGSLLNVKTLEESRLIDLPLDSIFIVDGNPKLTSNGLELKLLPFRNFCPGDVIRIDNAIIDLSTGLTSTESARQTYNTSYLSPNGTYMIRQVDYVFENRGKNFYLNLNCLSTDIYKGVTGVLK